MAGLTHKQEKFAQLVADGSTYAAAYREAYDVKKASPNNVYVKSSQLMDQDKIRIRVEEIIKERIKRNEITLDELLNRMARWVRFNPKSIYNERGCLKQWDEMSDDEAECISEITTEEIWDGRGKDRELIGYLKKVKIIDKRATADMFMKKFGAYLTKIKLDDDDFSHIQDLVNSINK